MNQESCWFQRKLPGTHISADSSKLPDPHFLSRIIKIQMNQVLQMTKEEKLAFQRVFNVNHEEHEAESSKFASRMKERTKKRKAGVLEAKNTSPYQNVDFICRPAAEVERLLPIEKYILSNSRARMKPHLFEALSFSKINIEYWDCRSV